MLKTSQIASRGFQKHDCAGFRSPPKKNFLGLEMASVRKVAISAQFAVKVTKWHVKQGHEIVKDANLASYVYCNRQEGSTVQKKLKSRFDGRVSRIVAKVGEEIPPG